jgi:hypothetical protein
MAAAILRLKPLSPSPDEPTIAKVLTSLNPLDLRKIMTVIDTDAALRGMYEELKEDYASLAYLGATSWPHPKNDEVLDVIQLHVGHIMCLIMTIDGALRVGAVYKGTPILISLAEFQDLFGVPLQESLASTATDTATAIRSVAAFCAAEAIEYDVSMINDDFAAFSRRIVAFSEDQIRKYAERLHLTITNIQGFDQ